MGLKVVVTGGRKYQNEAMIKWALSSLHETYTIDELIHGDASGADRLCGFWAMGNHVTCTACRPNWSDLSGVAVIKERRDGSKYNALAGHQRNQSMIDDCQPNYAVAFPGGNGTDDMVRRIKAAGIPLWDLRKT